MRLIVELARALDVPALRDISAAHIDGCLYHGQAALDFAEKLAADGTTAAVPTTLNVGSLDLLHPELYRGNDDARANSRRLMDCYERLGCEATWTCAPYLLRRRPQFGDQVAFGESNAIAFVNSVLGARTERYGDFVDACAAVTGRVPDFGLHRDENRRGEIVFDVRRLPAALLREDVVYPVLGHLVGLESGNSIPVLDGPATGDDRGSAQGIRRGCRLVWSGRAVPRRRRDARGGVSRRSALGLRARTRSGVDTGCACNRPR